MLQADDSCGGGLGMRLGCGGGLGMRLGCGGGLGMRLVEPHLLYRQNYTRWDMYI